MAANDESLDFAGALADSTELHVAIKLFGGVILDESIAAVNLYALVGDADGHFAREKLGHAGFACEADIFLIGEPRGLINEEARGLHLHGHVGELKLDGLKFANGLAELLALLRIFYGCVERSLRHAERKRGDGDASTVKNFEAADEAFTFRTKKIFVRHFAIRENHFCSVAGAHAKLVLFFAWFDARRSFLDDERADSARRSRFSCHRH